MVMLILGLDIILHILFQVYGIVI